MSESSLARLGSIKPEEVMIRACVVAAQLGMSGGEVNDFVSAINAEKSTPAKLARIEVEAKRTDAEKERVREHDRKKGTPKVVKEFSDSLRVCAEADIEAVCAGLDKSPPEVVEEVETFLKVLRKVTSRIGKHLKEAGR